MSPVRIHSIFRRQLIVLAAICFALIGNSRVQASCGDYLAHGLPTFGEDASLSEAGRPAVPEREQCDGPNCRAKPSSSVPVSQQRIVIPRLKCASYAPFVFDAAACVHTRHADPAAFYAGAFCLGIFRPPRV